MRSPRCGRCAWRARLAPAYNVQTAVDAEHALIVAHAVTLDVADSRCLEPMAEAAHQALDRPATLNIVADAGYSNGEQASRCEAAGLMPHVPGKRGVNNQGDGTLFDRSHFLYQPGSDSYLCPAGKTAGTQAAASAKTAPSYYQSQDQRLRELYHEAALHPFTATHAEPPHRRRRARPHAPAPLRS